MTPPTSEALAQAKEILECPFDEVCEHYMLQKRIALALEVAYQRGLERAAEVAEDWNTDRTDIAGAIRALKG